MDRGGAENSPWRMMLYSGAGDGRFLVVAPDGEAWIADHRAHLDAVQAYLVFTKPEMLLHYAHWLRDRPADRGRVQYPCRRHQERERQALAALRRPEGRPCRRGQHELVRRRALAASPGACSGRKRASPGLVSAHYRYPLRRHARCAPRAGGFGGGSRAGAHPCPPRPANDAPPDLSSRSRACPSPAAPGGAGARSQG